MNSNLLGIILLMTGSVFIYSGITDKDPRDVIKEALGGPPAKGAINSAIGGTSIPVTSTTDNSVIATANILTGPRYPITSV